MFQIFPQTDSNLVIDPIDLYLSDARPVIRSKPWILINMVNSIDGSISFDGRAGGLSGPSDKRVYQIIRSLADIILVGAGTIRAESYRAPRTPERNIAEIRKLRGQDQRPRLAVVSGQLNLDPKIGMFSESLNEDKPPIIYTTKNASQKRKDSLSSYAEIIEFENETISIEEILADLSKRNTKIVVCEGGPNLNSHLLAAGVIDEYCLTISPCTVGGNDPTTLIEQVVDKPTKLHLDRIMMEDDFLFCRYLTQK